MERAMDGAAGGSDSQKRIAQELVYDAWEATTGEEALELIQEALELDPENVDALMSLAEVSDYEPEEEIELMRKIVDIAAKRLGKKVFKKDRGHFGGLLETRPYLRARARLAVLLKDSGRIEEAAEHYAGMLDLNPNDNQGNRY